VSRGQRQQSGPPVTSVPALSSHQPFAVTDKVNRLLTLSRDAHEELDFRYFGNSRGQRSESKYTSTSVVPSLSSRRNTSCGYRWVTRLLPLGQPWLGTLRRSYGVDIKWSPEDYSSISHTW